MPSINAQSRSLPAELDAAVETHLARWQAEDRTRRLWERDASLWTGRDEASWLGWLDIVAAQLRDLAPLRRIRDEVRAEGFTDALLLGMGGSSLGPEVLAETFGAQPGHPRLRVLDSTDPAQVRSFEERVDLRRTIFVVSSKSGTTLEPNILKAHFLERARQVAGGQSAGSRFIAITDPGSRLETEARRERFRAVFHGAKSIGGRYSVLSNFGLVPAALMGLDVERLLREAQAMAEACGPGVPATDNPGVVLGTVVGVAARRGFDKLTLFLPPRLYDLGAWLEQLVAESTGKDGRAIVPVDRERPGPPAVYGDDRLFVYVRLQEAPDPAQEAAVEALEEAGRPVVRIVASAAHGLGQEFFRWEIATAVAGSILGVNPFDQPDVEASKVATRALTAAFERTGAFPAETPIFEEDGLRLFADPANARALEAAADTPRPLAGHLRAHLGRLAGGDYFALLAYLEMKPAHEEALQGLRHRVRDHTHAATCLGFGPRFLHSTGQAYKGGPNTGVFLQLTCDDARDLPVPGAGYTFGVVKAAQARGDFQVLSERGRRALRVHLGTDVETGLQALGRAFDRALSSLRR
jgi:glucose-6-phosphate isomerase